MIAKAAKEEVIMMGIYRQRPTPPPPLVHEDFALLFFLGPLPFRASLPFT
jgi:hypothetical protein